MVSPFSAARACDGSHSLSGTRTERKGVTDTALAAGVRASRVRHNLAGAVCGDSRRTERLAVNDGDYASVVIEASGDRFDLRCIERGEGGVLFGRATAIECCEQCLGCGGHVVDKCSCGGHFVSLVGVYIQTISPSVYTAQVLGEKRLERVA